MQDIDFDEIDRAVSSVTSDDTEARTSSPRSESTPSPAARRGSGRFMDVVHPSSDMRPSSEVQPRESSVPSIPREEVAPERTEAPDHPAPEATTGAAFHWPDPIEVAETPTPSEPEEAPVLEPTTENEATPLESPFLTDTKVEKRPLGAFSTTESGSELPLLEDFPAPTSSLTPTPAPEIEQEPADVPPELHSDVLLLDAHIEDEEVPELIPAHTETTPVDDIPTGPTSITQQYKERPSTASQPSGAIFDTEAYHQPLTHTAKKRSSAIIVVWIIALILIGGGIGAAVYFVVLPSLG